MENILKDINAVVGVMGSFVCDDDGQVLARLLPDILDEASLSPVGRTMAQTVTGLWLARRRKVNSVDLVYREGRLVVKNLRGGCLCILCVPTINFPLLNLTANVAARKVAKQIRANQAAPVEGSAPSDLKTRPLQSVPDYAGPTLNGTFFLEVEQELTRLIGPMAAFVIGEQVAALGATRGAFPLDKADQLVERLATEIADEDKRAQFQQMALEILTKEEAA
jgi:predicted regulator of Ras-like GTPase activity (Roadblock/LC7/MglB family)